MLVSIPVVTTCCCYFSLKTGTKIFGFISVLGCLTLALMSGLEIVWEKQSKHTDFKDPTLILVVDIVFQLVHMTTSIFLLLGTYQEKPKFIPPFLVSSVIVVFLELFYLPAFFFRFCGYGIHTYGHESLPLQLLMLLDDVYGWFIVCNFYQTLSPLRV